MSDPPNPSDHPLPQSRMAFDWPTTFRLAHVTFSRRFAVVARSTRCLQRFVTVIVTSDDVVTVGCLDDAAVVVDLAHIAVTLEDASVDGWPVGW